MNKASRLRANESKEPATASEASREAKSEWKKAQEDAEDAKKALNRTSAVVAGSIVWLVFTIGTWSTEMSILAKVGLTFVWLVGVGYYALKLVAEEEEKVQEKKQR